jgi:hypothetical protein
MFKTGSASVDVVIVIMLVAVVAYCAVMMVVELRRKK